MMNNGQFISMFPEVKPIKYDVELLKKFGESIEILGQIVGGGTSIPAGYTYFGQFIAHDLSHLKGSEVTSHGEPSPLSSFQQLSTPRLDLSPVYGNGFHDPRIAVDPCTGKMFYGFTKNGNSVEYGGDLPRTNTKMARIADRRNDDNLIIAQLHLTFLKLHNKIIENCLKVDQGCSGIDNFEKARREVINIYHEAIISDYLKRILHPKIYQKIIKQNYDKIWSVRPYEQLNMPVEFSAAAFRFGHSMVRRTYVLSPGGRIIGLSQLIKLTGKGNLAGEAYLPAEFKIDWEAFFQFKNSIPQPASPINPSTNLNIMHAHFPSENGHIATKNLLRGNEMNCPSAQSIIDFISEKDIGQALKPTVLVESVLNNPHRGRDNLIKDDALFNNIKNHTPLWYYLLAEATVAQASSNDNKSNGLGKLGSLIVAAVMRVILEKSCKGVITKDFKNAINLVPKSKLARPANICRLIRYT